LSYTTLNDENERLDREDVNPGIGLRWRPVPSHEVRLAASHGVKRRSAADLMLEPTVLAGFNQVQDDVAGTRYINTGIAYDWRINTRTLSGMELLHRELDVPVLGTSLANPDVGRSFDNLQQETTLHGYWNRILRPDLSLGLAVSLERSERDDSRNAEGSSRLAFPLSVETLSLPISIHYAHSAGFFAQSKTSLVHQSVERVNDENVGAVPENGSGVEKDDENFVNVDISLGFRLPTSGMTFRLDVNNLLDKAFSFQGSNIRSVAPSNARFSPGRTLVGRVSFSFR